MKTGRRSIQLLANYSFTKNRTKQNMLHNFQPNDLRNPKKTNKKLWNYDIKCLLFWKYSLTYVLHWRMFCLVLYKILLHVIVYCFKDDIIMSPLLLLLLSEACPDHNFFVFPDRSIIFSMWVHDHRRCVAYRNDLRGTLTFDLKV